jgi:hypothetical protein
MFSRFSNNFGIGGAPNHGNCFEFKLLVDPKKDFYFYGIRISSLAQHFQISPGTPM